jgi:drug/metabolite transporter (DMT)-like permease
MQLPSLSLLSQRVGEELAAQERRADGLDTKAGILLGFAGVVVGVTVDKLQGTIATVGTGLAALAALVAVLAFAPRSFPTLGLRRLRDS